MGQYYVAVLERNNKVSVFNPSYMGCWQGFKLIEHSWFRNDFMEMVSNKIYKKPTKVMWVGDYAEDEEIKALNPSLSQEKIQTKALDSKCSKQKELKGLYLVNHTKQVYIDLDRYYSIAEEFNVNTGWEEYVLNPISLLTAVGNNRGGGDYYNSEHTTCFDYVGTWANDLISLEDKAPVDFKEEKYIIFSEHVNEDNKNLIKLYGLENSCISKCK